MQKVWLYDGRQRKMCDPESIFIWVWTYHVCWPHRDTGEGKVDDIKERWSLTEENPGVARALEKTDWRGEEWGALPSLWIETMHQGNFSLNNSFYFIYDFCEGEGKVICLLRKVWENWILLKQWGIFWVVSGGQLGWPEPGEVVLITFRELSGSSSVLGLSFLRYSWVGDSGTERAVIQSRWVYWRIGDRWVGVLARGRVKCFTVGSRQESERN